jgi:WD40 repeat protein
MTGNILSGPLKGHTDWIHSIAFSQNGRRIVSGSSDCTILVWDAETGNILSRSFNGHTNGVSSVMFSQDGTRILSGSFDSSIRVWDAEPEEGPFQGHKASINFASSHDSPHMANSTGSIRHTMFNRFRGDSIFENGWVLNLPSELLFWVPPWARTGLWWPTNTVVIADVVTKLDLSQFVHGTSWHRCREAP